MKCAACDVRLKATEYYWCAACSAEHAVDYAKNRAEMMTRLIGVLRGAVMALAIVLMVACGGMPTAPDFSLYQWSVLSQDAACLHNAPTPAITRTPDRVIIAISGFQIVKWEAEHITAVFEVAAPFYRFCSVVLQ